MSGSDLNLVNVVLGTDFVVVVVVVSVVLLNILRYTRIGKKTGNEGWGEACSYFISMQV